jgi:hypothetical protein
MDLVVQATPTGMPGTEPKTQEHDQLLAGSVGSSVDSPMTGSLGGVSPDHPTGQETAPDPALLPERGVLGVFGFRRPVDPAGQSAHSPGIYLSPDFNATEPVIGGGSGDHPSSTRSPTSPVASGPVTVAGVDASWFGAGQLVVDLVYDPVRTPFLLEAERHGAAVRSGLGMLVHQAARQIIFWTGAEPPLDVMWKVVRDRPV